jgi:hypothetical protein
MRQFSDDPRIAADEIHSLKWDDYFEMVAERLTILQRLKAFLWR